MRIESTLRHRRPLSLTSLIDVIFLLLLFFMLSSTFTRFSEVRIAGGPAAVSAAAERPDILVRLSADGWAVNGDAMDETAAMAELARLKAGGAASAVVLVRGELNSQALVAAVEKIGRETGLKLTVAR